MSLAICKGNIARLHDAIAVEANMHGGFICPACEALEDLMEMVRELEQRTEELRVARKRIVELENLRAAARDAKTV